MVSSCRDVHACPFPADSAYDFYFPNPLFKSRWEGMSQRETPMLLAGGSSSIICIFPNLQNVNILGKKYAEISHFIPDEAPCHSLAPCSPLSESLTSGRQPEHLGFNTECWAVLMSAHAGASGSAQTRALPLSGL